MLEKQKGQALLIVVLVMVVALTIGLSVASRSIINLKNSQDQASSQKALSAAEAGASQALKAIGANQTSLNVNSISGNFTYNTTTASISALANTPFLVNGGEYANAIAKDNPGYIWTSTYSSGNPFADSWIGNLIIYWGEDHNNSCNNAALEITTISGDRSSPVLSRSAVDPCASRGNGFSGAGSATQAVGSHTFYYSTTLNLNKAYVVSVIPFYHDAFVAAKGTSDLPYQGANIHSVGTASNNVQQAVNVYQSYPIIPAELFPYTIYSP